MAKTANGACTAQQFSNNALAHSACQNAPLCAAALDVTPAQLTYYAVAEIFGLRHAVDAWDVYTLAVGAGTTHVIVLAGARALRQNAVLAAASIWAIRLASHLAARLASGFEDKRLKNMTASSNSRFKFCVAQVAWSLVGSC